MPGFRIEIDKDSGEDSGYRIISPTGTEGELVDLGAVADVVYAGKTYIALMDADGSMLPNGVQLAELTPRNDVEVVEVSFEGGEDEADEDEDEDEEGGDDEDGEDGPDDEDETGEELDGEEEDEEEEDEELEPVAEEEETVKG